LNTLSLIDADDFGEFATASSAAPSQLIERQSGQTLLEPFLNPPLPISRLTTRNKLFNIEIPIPQLRPDQSRSAGRKVSGRRKAERAS
jgi:hypothetical protein